jgi:hypothetical protein
MSKRETGRTAPTKAASTDAGKARSRSAAEEDRDRVASPEAGLEIVSNHPDQQEAWEIAADLIADLGAGDAVAWAGDYMLGLHEKGDWRGMQRWGMVASALDELAIARVH